MKRSLLVAALCGLMLSGPLATMARADASDAPIYDRPVYTSPQVVTDHSSSLEGRLAITVLLVVMVMAAAFAAN